MGGRAYTNISEANEDKQVCVYLQPDERAVGQPPREPPALREGGEEAVLFVFFCVWNFFFFFSFDMLVGKWNMGCVRG